MGARAATDLRAGHSDGQCDSPQAIIAEAGLSFLGLGVPPPEPSWGKDLADARSYLARAPWLWLAPGAFIAITVLSGNMFGDMLRDVLDPGFVAA